MTLASPDGSQARAVGSAARRRKANVGGFVSQRRCRRGGVELCWSRQSAEGPSQGRPVGARWRHHLIGEGFVRYVPPFSDLHPSQTCRDFFGS